MHVGDLLTDVGRGMRGNLVSPINLTSADVRCMGDSSRPWPVTTGCQADVAEM